MRAHVAVGICVSARRAPVEAGGGRHCGAVSANGAVRWVCKARSPTSSTTRCRITICCCETWACGAGGKRSVKTRNQAFKQHSERQIAERFYASAMRVLQSEDDQTANKDGRTSWITPTHLQKLFEQETDRSVAEQLGMDMEIYYKAQRHTHLVTFYTNNSHRSLAASSSTTFLSKLLNVIFLRPSTLCSPATLTSTGAFSLTCLMVMTVGRWRLRRKNWRGR